MSEDMNDFFFPFVVPGVMLGILLTYYWAEGYWDAANCFGS